MKVAELCRHSVVTIRPSDELTTAAALMRERHVGYLVVVEPVSVDGSLRPAGILTDRDIVVSVIARQTDAASLRVGEVMTQNPVVVGDSESVEEAVSSMRRVGVRRLPVVGSRGQLVGVISIDDVLDALAGQLMNVAGSIRNERTIEGALRP